MVIDQTSLSQTSLAIPYKFNSLASNFQTSFNVCILCDENTHFMLIGSLFVYTNRRKVGYLQEIAQSTLLYCALQE